MAGIRKSRRAPGKLSLKAMSIHFAAVTLVVTAMLAVFSENERSAAAASTGEPEAPKEDAITKTAHGEAVNGIVIKQPRETTGEFGPDQAPPRASGSIAYAEEHEPGYEPLGPPTGKPPRLLPAALPPGMTLEEWLALHEAKEDGAVPMQLSAAELNALRPSGTMENATPIAQ